MNISTNSLIDFFDFEFYNFLSKNLRAIYFRNIESFFGKSNRNDGIFEMKSKSRINILKKLK